MSRIKRTRRSQLDVTKIWTYIAEKNFTAAEAWVEKVDAKLRLLSQNPLMGESIDSLRNGARRFTVGNYVLYFEPIEDGIRLLRVVHSARQLDDLFD